MSQERVGILLTRYEAVHLARLLDARIAELKAKQRATGKDDQSLMIEALANLRNRLAAMLGVTVKDSQPTKEVIVE